MDLVSVIIPVYNRVEEIERSINSVLNQTYSNFEIIIIDDKSENFDEISEIIKEKNDFRLKLISNTKNKKNANVCRNIGLEEAKGEYIFYLDSDDEWKNNHLEHRIQLFLQKQPDVIFGSAEVYRGNKKVGVKISRDKLKSESPVDYVIGSGSSTTPTISISSTIKNVRWNEDLHRHQDYQYVIDLFNQTENIFHDKKPTAIINWPQKGRKVFTQNQIESLILFYQRNKKNISPDLKAKYLPSVFKIATQNKQEKASKYYLNEIRKNIMHFTLVDFMGCFEKQNIYSKIALRVRYLFWVLIS